MKVLKVKGEHPNTHLMEFEDYLQASNIPTVPGRDEHGAEVNPVDYENIINKFKASLKNKARLWYNMHIEGRVQNKHTREG